EYRNVIQIPGGPIEIAPAGYKKYGEFDYFRNQGFIGDFLKGFDVFFKSEESLRKLKKQGFLIKFKSLQNSIRMLSGVGLGDTYRSYKVIMKIHQSLVELLNGFLLDKSLENRLYLAKEWLGNVINTCNARQCHAVILDQPI